MGDNRQWLRATLERINKQQKNPLGTKGVERALDIAEAACKSNVTRGEASRIGIDAVKRERDK